jgi:hypothetical protein
MSGISIVFPHLLNPENDRVLDLNLRMIRENTTCPYEVLFVASTPRSDLVYTGLDWLMRNAAYDLILWHSTDVLLAPAWNENVILSAADGDWIGLELVECGQIGVSPTNIAQDFGITAATFRREEFEVWCADQSKDRPKFRPGFSWFSPSVWRKQWYIDNGGFDCSKPFPNPNDEAFRHRVNLKQCRFIVAKSFAYHFQRARENTGERPERK